MSCGPRNWSQIPWRLTHHEISSCLQIANIRMPNGQLDRRLLLWLDFLAFCCDFGVLFGYGLSGHSTRGSWRFRTDRPDGQTVNTALVNLWVGRLFPNLSSCLLLVACFRGTEFFWWTPSAAMYSQSYNIMHQLRTFGTGTLLILSCYVRFHP